MLTRSEIDKLHRYIQQAREDHSVDLKAMLPLDKDAQREKFAVDICALANTGVQKAYLIIGVHDRKARKQGKPAVPGIEIDIRDPQSEEAFEQKLSEAAEQYCERPPELSVEFLEVEGKTVAIISISATNRPYMLQKAPAEVRIRRGSQNKRATVREIIEMQREALRREMSLEISETIITKSERYRDNKALMRVLQDVLSDALGRARTSTREQHRYHYLMAKLYWLTGDPDQMQRCKGFIERAIRDQEAEPAYWYLKAEVCIRIAEEHTRLYDKKKSEQVGDYFSQAYMPVELDDASSELDDASYALETARDMGGSMNDFIDLSNKLEETRMSIDLEIAIYDKKYATAEE